MACLADRSSRTAGLVAAALMLSAAGLSVAPVRAAPGPATFEEGVGIQGDWAFGSDLALAETAELIRDWGSGGGGHGRAVAGDIVPIQAAVELHLAGPTVLSAGFGATSYVLTRYQFEIVALDASVPDYVTARIAVSGTVTVDTDRPGGPGATFARLVNPIHPFEVNNSDPVLGYRSGHWEDHAMLEGPLQVGIPHLLEVYLWSHGEVEGLAGGPAYHFDAEAFMSSSVAVAGEWAASTRIAYGPGIVLVPEPATGWLWACGLAALGIAAGRRKASSARARGAGGRV